MTGNRIPESYLKRFLPSQGKPQDTMPADIAAFLRSITGDDIPARPADYGVTRND